MKLRYQATANVCEFLKTSITPDNKAAQDLTVPEKEQPYQGLHLKPVLQSCFELTLMLDLNQSDKKGICKQKSLRPDCSLEQSDQGLSVLSVIFFIRIDKSRSSSKMFHFRNLKFRVKKSVLKALN